MSRPRFLADQDFNEHVIQGVWRLEPAVQFLRVRDVGLDEKSDSDVLEYAAKENWIVISHDVNTMSAAANTRLAGRQPMTGLFLVHQLSSLGSLIDCLILVWAASEAEEWVDQVVFLPF
jgi:predicted nuclease of predicted toxin-antitoxin system